MADGDGGTTAKKKDLSWRWVAGAIVIGLVVGIVLNQVDVPMMEFNWPGLLNLFLGVSLFWIGIAHALSANSEEGELGWGHMLFALFLIFIGGVMTLKSVLPPSIEQEYHRIAFIYKSKDIPKPHLSEVVPAPLPDIAWVKIDLPPSIATPAGVKSTIPVSVQIEMTEEEAKLGFPVLKSALDAHGKIVGWYGKGESQSKGDDL